jgi:ribonucleoside-diphosphate reductase alpha chain
MASEINKAWKYVESQTVLPSMRSMQFGGLAIEENHARMYNCSFTHINRSASFAETFYLLLCGCGVGFSVQTQHVNQLPQLPMMSRTVEHWDIADSIEGWAEALDVLVDSSYRGIHVEFNYSKIRHEGAPLITTGGLAPGHLPLRKLLEQIRSHLLLAQGRKLTTLECFDILCHAAEGVLAGGIRRSSLIGLFSVDDTLMRSAKSSINFSVNTHRRMANISAVLHRYTTTEKEFIDLMNLNLASHGEPGFVFVNDLDYGVNPCGEIGLHPVGDGISGIQFCNLTEVNVSACKTPQEFYRAVEAATVIGTLQAGYTDFKFINSVSGRITNRDALLGVSLTGMCDNPEIAFNPEVLHEAALVAVNTNLDIAARIGISPAARITCVKPSGTASLLLGCVGSGIHNHHAKRYFRRVVLNRNEPLAVEFLKTNPHMIEIIDDRDCCVVFPVETEHYEPITAMEFLERIKLVYRSWVAPGSFHSQLTNSVSATVEFKPEEFRGLLDFVWENRALFTCLTFVPAMSDKEFPHMPREAVSTDLDARKWSGLVETYNPIDYSKVGSKIDVYDSACEGDRCDILINREML